MKKPSPFVFLVFLFQLFPLFSLFQCVIFIFSSLISTTALAGLPAIETNSLAPMIEKVSPAVVNIKAQIKINDFETLLRLKKEKQLQGGDDNTPLPDQMISIASGVIVDAKKGYVLTNAHAVRDAQHVIVTLNDARHYTAKIIGIDVPSDIALLQIQAKNLNAILFGNSNLLKVGDPVIAIGNPFGIGQTVTSGIVSGLKRSSLGIESLENFIQTDASINPGNSGGALLDTQGQLIGINTAIVSPDRGSTGIGLAIPANMAKSVMLQLIEYGDVKRGALGVGVQDITPDLADAFNFTTSKGAVVTETMPNSPAAKAGLEVGDVIVSINNSEIKNANDVVNEISFLRVDSKATITILRGNKVLTVKPQIWDIKQSRETSEKMNPLLYGVSLKNFKLLSPQHGHVQGVLVVSVEEDSHAWQADLHPGDVIVAANQKKVTNMDELNQVTATSNKKLLLNVLRGAGAVFLVIKTTE